MANEVEIVTVEVPRPRYPFVPETIPTDEPVSVHFVVGEEVLLFGTGYASGAFELIRAIDRIGGLDVVIVEHGDPDHYDSVPILKELYDDLSVAVPADDAGVLESNGIEADVLLEHDDVRWGVRAIHVPGHSPGNMSFLHESAGTLLVGDTVVHSSSGNAAPGDWSGQMAPMKPELNDDDGRTRSNIAILEQYRFDQVRITHGPNIEAGGRDELDTLLEDLRTG